MDKPRSRKKLPTKREYIDSQEEEIQEIINLVKSRKALEEKSRSKSK